MIIAYIIAYIASYIAAKAGHNILSGIILVFIALALYVSDYLRSKNLIDLRGLFALSFVGGEGVACLKLSYLQTAWEIETWLCFFFAFIVFYLVYEILFINRDKLKLMNKAKAIKSKFDFNRLFTCIIVLTAVSLACFSFEAVVLGYIPLFVKGVPHAYSYFHISGVHYFTVSCVLVPAFSVVWLLKSERKNWIWILICNIVCLAIPLLCVSRFQFIFAIVLAVFTYIVLKRTVPVKIIVSVIVVGIAAFALLSIARSHDAEYLNSIFEMKINLPVDISRIYIYIANNYDNFNRMVCDLPAYSYGLKQLFPVWALTGLKFVFPALVNYPLFVTKEELTTLTMFYDMYYDFGVVGVFLGSAIVGAAAYALKVLTIDREDDLLSVVYSQMGIYMALAFFTTWFSNPTTWFYLVASLIIYFICKVK